MAGGVILGIDPGLGGALAFLSARGRVETFDMPITAAARGNMLDEATLARMIDGRSRDIEFALLERQQTRPNDGRLQAFKTGCGYGALRMVLAANFVPYALVTPAVWKRFLGVTADKDQCRGMASQLFPEDAAQWARKKDDGRAEAALLAYYGRTHPVRSEAA